MNQKNFSLDFQVRKVNKKLAKAVAKATKHWEEIDFCWDREGNVSMLSVSQRHLKELAEIKTFEDFLKVSEDLKRVILLYMR